MLKSLAKILAVASFLALAGLYPARAECAGEAIETCMDKEFIGHAIKGFLGHSYYVYLGNTQGRNTDDSFRRAVKLEINAGPCKRLRRLISALF